MSDKTGGPAFPVPMFAVGHGKYEAEQLGISMRDYFAAKAMTGFISAVADHTRELPYTDTNLNFIACRCYKMADEMLKARQR